MLLNPVVMSMMANKQDVTPPPQPAPPPVVVKSMAHSGIDSSGTALDDNDANPTFAHLQHRREQCRSLQNQQQLTAQEPAQPLHFHCSNGFVEGVAYGELEEPSLQNQDTSVCQPQHGSKNSAANNNALDALQQKQQYNAMQQALSTQYLQAIQQQQQQQQQDTEQKTKIPPKEQKPENITPSPRFQVLQQAIKDPRLVVAGQTLVQAMISDCAGTNIGNPECVVHPPVPKEAQERQAEQQNGSVTTQSGNTSTKLFLDSQVEPRKEDSTLFSSNKQASNDEELAMWNIFNEESIHDDSFKDELDTEANACSNDTSKAYEKMVSSQLSQPSAEAQQLMFPAGFSQAVIVPPSLRGSSLCSTSTEPTTRQPPPNVAAMGLTSFPAPVQPQQLPAVSTYLPVPVSFLTPVQFQQQQIPTATPMPNMESMNVPVVSRQQYLQSRQQDDTTSLYSKNTMYSTILPSNTARPFYGFEGAKPEDDTPSQVSVRGLIQTTQQNSITNPLTASLSLEVQPMQRWSGLTPMNASVSYSMQSSYDSNKPSDSFCELSVPSQSSTGQEAPHAAGVVTAYASPIQSMPIGSPNTVASPATSAYLKVAPMDDRRNTFSSSNPTSLKAPMENQAQSNAYIPGTALHNRKQSPIGMPMSAPPPLMRNIEPLPASYSTSVQATHQVVPHAQSTLLTQSPFLQQNSSADVRDTYASPVQSPQAPHPIRHIEPSSKNVPSHAASGRATKYKRKTTVVGGGTITPKRQVEDQDSPNALAMVIIRQRGYPTDKVPSADSGYQMKPTPLQLASFGTQVVKTVDTSNVQMLKILLECGLSPNPCNAFGDSVVDLVCKRGNHDLLKCLVDHGCDLRVCDGFGRTPLHYAAWARTFSEGLAALILRFDPLQILVQDKQGQTPLQYVRKELWGEWVAFLNKHKDVYWPIGGRFCHQDFPRKRCNFIPDPENAVSVDLAQMIVSGSISPQSVMAMDMKTRRHYKYSSAYSPLSR